jgi:beta-galactosidase
VTPVHVYTSGDEAELFLNGRSLGRKKKEPAQYRLRWHDVVYEPGELRVVAYKKGRTWANKTVRTAGSATRLLLTPDRTAIAGDGKDLSFMTATVADEAGSIVPRSINEIHFEISGPGEIVATDNGDPTDMVPFPSKDRKAFNGLALVIVRTRRGERGRIVVSAKADGLREARANIDAR